MAKEPAFDFEAKLTDGREVLVEAIDIQPAEPDVGIMQGGPTEIRVTVAAGIDITDELPESEYDRLMVKAAEVYHDRLSEDYAD